MAQRILLSELRLIQDLYKSGSTQKDIKSKVDLVRQDEGRYEGKGISTNTISELSPTSKHRLKRTTAIYDYHDKHSVIEKIMICMDYNKDHATRIYNNNIIPLCSGAFHDPGNNKMVSIRYYPPSCDSKLYYIFYTEDYQSFDDEAEPEDNLWTIRTDHEYMEILNGSLDRHEIEIEMAIIADGKYTPYLSNVCVLKKS